MTNRLPAPLVLILIVCASCAGAAAPDGSTVVGVSSTSAPGESPGATTTQPTQAPSPQSTDAPTTTTTATSTTTTTTTTAPAAPLEGVTIVLDPGHNGMNWAHPDEINALVDIGTITKPCNTTGTATADGFPEATFNWEVALLTRTRLEALGATVTMTRQDNEGWGPCITERAAIGNRSGAAAVISIHADGGPESGRGFHVIYPKVVAGLTDDIAEDSRRLATDIRSAVMTTEMPIADYIGEDGFSVRDDLGGLNLSDVPVMFLEAGNMKNASDAALLTDPDFQASLADALVAGL
ncbi:MAG: N-acetylmuramoyl-L-alanine amidase, partial [Acidimicrobiia bacterium]